MVRGFSHIEFPGGLYRGMWKLFPQLSDQVCRHYPEQYGAEAAAFRKASVNTDITGIRNKRVICDGQGDFGVSGSG